MKHEHPLFVMPGDMKVCCFVCPFWGVGIRGNKKADSTGNSGLGLPCVKDKVSVLYTDFKCNISQYWYIIIISFCQGSPTGSAGRMKLFSVSIAIVF